MAYPTIKLKKSSVPGRAPTVSDLDYGEIAINYADGKIYYKNSSNVVMGHFIDSDIQDQLTRVIANQEFAFRTTDSLSEGDLNLYYTRIRSESDIIDIVDSAYIQFLQMRYLDSASAINLIDSAYIHSILTGDGQLDLTGSLVVTGNVTSNSNLVSNYSSGDEGGEINLATAATNNVLNGGHVNIDIYQNRLRFFEAGSPNRGAYIDLSQADTGVAYNLLTGGAGLSQAQVIALIDSPYVQARQIKYDFLDSSEAIHLIDSAYVNARLNRSLFLDSSEAINLIDIYAFDSASFNGMFAAKSTTNLAEGTNKYYTKVRFDSDFATDFALRTTSNLTEGSNKYYTKVRFDSDFGTKTTSNLTEGTNKYYTKVRSDSDFNVGFALKTTTNLAEGSNKYYTKARSDSDFGSNFALKTTTNLTEGTNKYYTKGRFDSDFGSKTTTNLTEGTNKYYTTARADSDAKRAISVTDAGGDGSLSYSSSTGVITYTGPSATEVRAHFTAGTGVSISSGQVSIGQSVGTTDDVTFGKVTVDSAVVDAVYLGRKTTAPSSAAGTLFWDSNPQNGLSFIPTTNEGNTSTTINVGQKSLIYVHNLTGETIPIGTAVYISGTAHGAHPSITKAKADNAATARAVGLTTMELVDNAHGYVAVFGLVKNLNTGGLTAGADVYLSKDSAGKFTTTPVTVQTGYPFHIGKVVKADSNIGSILVNPYSEHFEYLKIQDDLVVAGLSQTSTLKIDSSLTMVPIDHMARPAWAETTMWYDQDGKTYAFHTADSDYIQFVGEREFVRGRNSSGALIPKGTPVYTTGVHISGDPIHGHHPLIYPADAATDGHFEVIGITGHDIKNGQHGYVITRGWISDINTIGLVSGSRFHLAPAGGFQLAAPAYPNFPVDLGIALSIDSTVGSIYVNVKDHTLEQLRVTNDARVDGDLTVGGNLNVVGTTTSTSLQQIQVSSNFLKLLEGNTLATSYLNDSPSGLNDAVFIGSYRGDSDFYYFIDMVSTDSTGDIIRFGISSTSTIVEGQYGVAFDSAGSGKTTWNLLTDGLTAPLRNNISIQFVNATGHSDSDLWSAHPTALNLDLGFVGNYNPAGAGGIRYAGVYRDVNDSRWKFFEGLNQNLDSAVVTISDSNGFTLANVQANTFYGALSGNATTATSATQLATVRTFTIAGDVTASAQNFDGTGNVTLTTNIATGVIVNADISATAAIEDTKLATISTAGKVQNGATTATSANTGSAIVARDVSGNFSAGTITAALSGNATTATSAGSVTNSVTFDNGGTGAVSGTTFNGGAAQTISYNTLGASPLAGSSSLTTTGTVTSGTWSGSFGAVSGANLTSLTAGNLTGTIPSTVLGNSTHYIGTTAVTLNRASANLGLTGITSIAMPGATSGTVTITPAATAGTTAITIPATTGTLITSGDTGTVTSTMIADGTIVNGDINASAAIVDTKLATISTAGKVSNSATTATDANTASAIVARDASGNFTAGTITAALTGNASTATTLQTARTIGDVSFNGSANIAPERIVYKDTRSTDFVPHTYDGVTLHLKTNTTDGLADGGTYHGVLDLAHWSDASGGVNHQLGMTDNGSLYIRYSTGLSTWSSWTKIYDAGDAATANTASTLVLRDGSGNFSAGTITAALTGNASTATTLQTARTIAISGDVTGTATSFNGGANISISSTITAGSIVSADFNTATSLIIYNSAGTALKTVYSPGS